MLFNYIKSDLCEEIINSTVILKRTRFLFLLIFVCSTFFLKETVSANGFIRYPFPENTDTSIFLNTIKIEAYQTSQYLRTIPGSLSVLTGENIQKKDGLDFSTVLNSLPGVTMQNGTFLTNRIVIRGMGSRTPYNTNRIKVYLNQIPLTSSDGVSSPEELDLQNLGRIEIIKGTASSLYGSGLGGSINMFTPAVKNNSGYANLHYGSFNTRKISASGTLNNEKLNLWASISNFESDGYRENNSYRRNSFITTTGWKRNRLSLELILLAIDVKGGIPSSIGETLFKTNPKAAASNWKAIGGFKEYTKGVGGITLQYQFSERIVNQITFFGRRNQSFEKRPFNNLDDQSNSKGFRNKLIYHNHKSDWVFGIENISDSYLWEFIKNDIQINKNKETRNHTTAFFLLYYKPLHNLNLTIGSSVNSIQYKLTDLFPTDGNHSGKRHFPVTFSPRFGINYSFGHNFTFYASSGHGFSLPSPEETLLPEGTINPDIKPETGIQFELGTRIFSNKNRFDLDIAVYRIDLQNLLVTKRLTEEQFTGINAGKTNHRGIEIALKKDLFYLKKFPGTLSSALSYFHSVNRFIEFNDNGNIYNGNQLPGIPKQTFMFQIKWNPYNSIEILTDLNYSGKQFIDDSNKLDYPGHFTASLKLKTDFNISKKIGLSVYGGIINLTDTHYASMLIVNAIATGKNEPRYFYPGLPRNFYSGIQISY